VWMHNGFLQVEGQKMSKSLGNFVTINDVLKGNSGAGIIARVNMLKTHYRQPIDWTSSGHEEANRNLVNWHGAINRSHLSFVEENRGNYSQFSPDVDFLNALADDLNTPAAFSVLHRLSGSQSHEDIERLFASLSLIGVFDFDLLVELQSKYEVVNYGRDHEKIERMLHARIAARAAKDWKESDRIRDELDAMGIAIKDNKDGTTSWEVKR
jgi:cysteinyl-tRNA synthetase